MTIQKRARLTILLSLCLALCMCTTAFADTDGTEPQIDVYKRQELQCAMLVSSKTGLAPEPPRSDMRSLWGGFLLAK